jgi:hypothetical protein
MEVGRRKDIRENDTPSYAKIESPAPSRLLALPVEIRRLIYGFVFGGNWLHVGTEGSTVRSCLKPHRFRLRYEVIKNSPTRQRFVQGLASHDECFAEYSEGVTANQLCLGLLQVCRQVYDEARLVPFSANTFIFKQRSVLQRFYLVQGWERGLALRRAVLMHLLDSDYGLHHLIPNVKHVLIFVLLYRRIGQGARERSYTRTFLDYRSDIRSLASAKVCLEFCSDYDAEGLGWLNDWDFRMAESNIEDLLIKGTPLSARTLSLLAS